jgi:hypothetical protein
MKILLEKIFLLKSSKLGEKKFTGANTLKLSFFITGVQVKYAGVLVYDETF